MMDVLHSAAAVDWSPVIRVARWVIVIAAPILLWHSLPALWRVARCRDVTDNNRCLALIAVLLTPIALGSLQVLLRWVSPRTDPISALVIWMAALGAVLGLVWIQSIRRMARRARSTDLIDQADCIAMAKLRRLNPGSYDELQIELRGRLQRTECA